MDKVKVPPIKCQGIKTKLVDFILSNVEHTPSGTWIEPFVGSGVVGFNLAPQNAIFADTNVHIINFYNDVVEHKINAQKVRDYLNEHGRTLNERGKEYYYEVRERFNNNPNSLDFLFLNRACFNGIMRFNKKGFFNVPFNHKPDRFRQAYVTKIVNQIKWVQAASTNKNWKFISADWKDTLKLAQPGDFVYLDPPYIGRHTDYFNQWEQEDADKLSETIQQLPCKFAYSMWKENKFRKNEHILKHWSNFRMETMSHFYHVGSTEKLRNAMEEALIINY